MVVWLCIIAGVCKVNVSVNIILIAVSHFGGVFFSFTCHFVVAGGVGGVGGGVGGVADVVGVVDVAVGKSPISFFYCVVFPRARFGMSGCYLDATVFLWPMGRLPKDD